MTTPRSDGRSRGGTTARSAYRAALQGLYARRRFGLRPGLEVEQALLAELGHPEGRLPAIHVTGSKGKGSVATMAAAALSAHGLRTGLFTSPHLASYRERVRVDGTEIGVDDVVDGLARVEAAAARLARAGTIDREPTFFEVTTALALDWFARQEVDAAVVEVGIGGRLDATNVLASRVGVVTTIELEHTDLLGGTVGAIATEKAGIFHRGMRGVVGELPADAATAVARTTDHLGVPVWTLGREVRAERTELRPDGQTMELRFPGVELHDLELPLLGAFQVGNAALALAAVARFLDVDGASLEPAAVRRALGQVKVPGRLQRLARDPELIYDVAHTPGSARAVAVSVAEIAPLADPASSAIVFGCLAGKEVGAILESLAPVASTLVVVPVRSERAMPLGEMRAAAVGKFARVVVAPNAGDGVRLARAATGPDGVTLVVGSDYLVGELLRGPGDADEPDLSDPGHGPAPEPGAAPRHPRGTT
ncbi:MAG TPA: Mur ligase family protein [Thermoplasmata archaeon]|nr:Mur ligase family protein [Thermoplasmata archaeon]